MENDFKESLKVYEEIIDGVRVVHTGKTDLQHKGYEHKGFKRKRSWEGGGYEDLGYEDLGYEEVERLEMYDTNGNRFYSNCPSLEEAQQLVEKLKAEGKDAVIGPKSPRSKNKNAVGVYFVKAIEEQQKSNPENEISE